MDSWERIRELGVLRAAGMSRRQVWRSVLVEAGIIGTIGGLVGSVAGLVVGALLLGFAGGCRPRSRCRGRRSRRRSSSASGWRCWPRPSRPGSPAGDRSWRPSGRSLTASATGPRALPRLVDSARRRARRGGATREADVLRAAVDDASARRGEGAHDRGLPGPGAPRRARVAPPAERRPGRRGRRPHLPDRPDLVPARGQPGARTRSRRSASSSWAAASACGAASSPRCCTSSSASSACRSSRSTRAASRSCSARPAATSSGSCSPAPSSVGLRSSAGTGGSAARSAPRRSARW